MGKWGKSFSLPRNRFWWTRNTCKRPSHITAENLFRSPTHWIYFRSVKAPGLINKQPSRLHIPNWIEICFSFSIYFLSMIDIEHQEIDNDTATSQHPLHRERDSIDIFPPALPFWRVYDRKTSKYITNWITDKTLIGKSHHPQLSMPAFLANDLFGAVNFFLIFLYFSTSPSWQSMNHFLSKKKQFTKSNKKRKTSFKSLFLLSKLCLFHFFGDKCEGFRPERVESRG